MPVTAKLSRKFYETFGDDIANELVDWFNQVDATYRTELRELNELNFARFDAKLEQRIAEVKAEVRQEIGALRTELRTGFARLEGSLIARIALAETRQTRLNLAAWIATLGAVVALTKL